MGRHCHLGPRKRERAPAMRCARLFAQASREKFTALFTALEASARMRLASPFLACSLCACPPYKGSSAREHRTTELRLEKESDV
jgi:hypothetical protein